MENSNGNGDKRPRFNQLPEAERRARVDDMQGIQPLDVRFVMELQALTNGQVAVGTPDTMLDSVKGCAMVIDVLAKAIRVITAKLAKLQPVEMNRIHVVGPGAVPPYTEG